MNRHPILPFIVALCAATAGFAGEAAVQAQTPAAADAGGKPAAPARKNVPAVRAPASAPAPQPGPKSGPAGAASMPHRFVANRPWAVGVSAAEQKAAVALFEKGNTLLQESLFSDAVKKYRAALRHWDHPAIHYNMALALLNLDQPIGVYENLKKATAYGIAPLDADKFEHAKNYMQLVRKSLASVDISCDRAGAKVSMDGKLLFTAPGHYQGLVRAGDHNIVAAKAGFVTDNQTRTLEPDRQYTFQLHLYTAEQLTRYRRRWKVWKPWVVVGAGAGIGLIGGILHWRARSNFSDYDAGIRACNGCVPDATLSGLKNSANTDQALAIVSYALGGAALVTGLALVYINQPHPYRIEGQPPSPSRIAVAPLFGGGTTGVTALFRF